MVTWFIGAESLIASILNAPDYLINLYPNKTQVIIGVLLELINATVVVGIAVLMFPILKKYNENIALGYVGFRIIESVILIVSAIRPLSLITLSQEYLAAGAPDASYFQTLGALSMAERFSAGQMVPIAVGLGGMMFCYLLYQSKLIPRFLSAWGLIGYAVLLIGGLLDMLGFSTGLIKGLPVASFEIFIAIWLIVKGFNASAIASESA